MTDTHQSSGPPTHNFQSFVEVVGASIVQETNYHSKRDATVHVTTIGIPLLSGAIAGKGTLRGFGRGFDPQSALAASLDNVLLQLTAAREHLAELQDHLHTLTLEAEDLRACIVPRPKYVQEAGELS